MYQEIIDQETDGMIIRYTDPSGKVWSIPANESNRMYRKYLNTKAQ